MKDAFTKTDWSSWSTDLDARCDELKAQLDDRDRTIIHLQERIRWLDEQASRRYSGLD